MNDRLRLIPYPKKVTLKGGTTLCHGIKFSGPECFECDEAAKFIKGRGGSVSEQGLLVEYAFEGCTLSSREAYCMDISENAIKISVNKGAGLLYAFATLKQLLVNYGNNLPRCYIEDEPEYEYRGFMLDVGRYFFAKNDVFRLVDLCVLNKLNVLHLHLTEDQGWRIQIDKYPLLTQKGSVRSHTNFGIKPHGGYYTKDDIREIIAYCNARNIEVIPEIDMPGHMRAALACYPELGCFGRQLDVATHSGVKHDILCAGKQSTYQFVFDVLDEVIELFGQNTKFIHLGGDEAVKMRWEICPDCQKTMKENGIATENGLQAYFMSKVADHVVSKGMTPIMWNETDLSLPCHEKMVWQLWTTGNDSVTVSDICKAASARGGIINSDSAYAYLDLPYSDINLKKSYEFNPVPQGLDKDKFVGAEVALWTEYVPDFKTACVRLLPRMCALSEVLWGKNGDSFEEFNDRLRYTAAFYRIYGYGVSPYKTAMPGKVRAFFQKLWFERRQLHWEGLHNLIEDKKVKAKYAKK